jgi:hypothetical protein
MISHLLTFVVLSSAAAPIDEPEHLKPINLAVNTACDEDDPHISSDGYSLYYTATAKGRSEILRSKRSPRNSAWLPGSPLMEIGDRGDTRSVFITPEGRYPQFLYFGTNFDPEKKDGIGSNFDLYFLIKQGPKAEFTTQTPLHFCTPLDELYPWLAADGKQLYFSRKHKDGWHIYVATRPVGGGQWGKPARLALPADFHHATLTPDGTLMYLQGPLEKKHVGLFRSLHTPTGWSQPEPLTMLNCPDAPSGDRSPCLSRDGSKLYFASDRPGGKGGWDLWVIATSQLKKKSE